MKQLDLYGALLSTTTTTGKLLGRYSYISYLQLRTLKSSSESTQRSQRSNTTYGRMTNEGEKGEKLTPFDGYPTPTSVTQHETEEILLRHLAENSGPVLNKSAHMQFLVKHLIQGFPSRYASQDASQPWLLFWILQSFSCLGVVLDPVNKQKYVEIRLTSVA